MTAVVAGLRSLTGRSAVADRPVSRGDGLVSSGSSCPFLVTGFGSVGSHGLASRAWGTRPGRRPVVPDRLGLIAISTPRPACPGEDGDPLAQESRRTARTHWCRVRFRNQRSGSPSRKYTAVGFSPRANTPGILAYDDPISTGPLEGTNTKIQGMKRQAYGFRDRAFYKLKILAIHESQYALVG